MTPANRRPNRSSKRKSAQVPEQYWGYSLQVIRFLHLLLVSSPSSNISLEVFEDAGCTDESGATLASQTKTGLVKNPIADRAVDFWKTLSNWAEAVKTGMLDPDKTVFEIYVGRRHTGPIAQTFSVATTPTTAAQALEDARMELWGSAPFYPKRANVATVIRDYVDVVLDPGNDDVRKIICNFRLTFASKSPLDDLRPAVEAKWVRPELSDELIKYAHGWVKEKIDALIQDRKPAVINVDDFNREMMSFLPRLDFNRILANFAGMPSVTEIAGERLRTYVDQLKLIESSEEQQIEAINDYLRASVMRSKWGEQGIIHEQSFAEFGDALVTFWRNKARQNRLAHKGLSPIEQGQLLLTDCCVHNQPLQGLPVPSFFTPGSYHALADELEVGWHPDYKTKLNQRAQRGR